MIYVVITMFLFLVEMLCWGLRTSYVYLEHRRWMLWISNHTPPDPILMLLHHFGLTLNSANTGNFTKAGRTQVKRMLEWWENSRWTGLVDALLRVIEVGNSIWRVCIFRAFSPKLVRLVPGLKGSWDLFHPKFDPERNILTPNSFRLAYIISAQT